MTKNEALKLALEALSPWAGEDANHTEQYAAYHAIRETLAEQETVLPGGGHVPAVPVAVYGYCPECGGAGVMRERRPNGDDKCTNGHKYPSSKALAEQPAQPEQCQCPACKIAPHASDCPVHNEPAWPNGPCDCGAQPEQEPVAWMIWLHGPAGHFDHKQFAELEFDRRNKEYPDPDRKLLPLYTTPPQRKPLSMQERTSIVRANKSFHDKNEIDAYGIIDDVEAAHGIKE